jgi:plastocyanin
MNDNISVKPFDSALIAAGKTFSHESDAAATYDYFCTVGPTMVGPVIVK